MKYLQHHSYYLRVGHRKLLLFCRERWKMERFLVFLFYSAPSCIHKNIICIYTVNTLLSPTTHNNQMSHRHRSVNDPLHTSYLKTATIPLPIQWHIQGQLVLQSKLTFCLRWSAHLTGHLLTQSFGNVLFKEQRLCIILLFLYKLQFNFNDNALHSFFGHHFFFPHTCQFSIFDSLQSVTINQN